MKTIRSIEGKHIAITGNIPGGTQSEVIRAVKANGGKIAKGADPSRRTDIFIRGQSDQWKYGKYGSKEAHVAHLIREGQKIAIIAGNEAWKLLEEKPVRCLDYIAGQPVAWLTPPSSNAYNRISKLTGPLDREHTINGRKEQAYLRNLLFEGADIAACSICERKLPTTLLVAAHIKPRSECTAKEKRDALHIVFSVCQLGCDALYERGFLSVNSRGKVVATRRTGITLDLKRALKAVKGRSCPAWNSETEQYFDWHYSIRFQG